MRQIFSRWKRTRHARLMPNSTFQKKRGKLPSRARPRRRRLRSPNAFPCTLRAASHPINPPRVAEHPDADHFHTSLAHLTTHSNSALIFVGPTENAPASNYHSSSPSRRASSILLAVRLLVTMHSLVLPFVKSNSSWRPRTRSLLAGRAQTWRARPTPA